MFYAYSEPFTFHHGNGITSSTAYTSLDVAVNLSQTSPSSSFRNQTSPASTRDGLAFEGDDVGTDAVKEPAIMADDFCYLIQSLMLHTIVAEFVLLTEITSLSSIIDDKDGEIKDYQ